MGGKVLIGEGRNRWKRWRGLLLNLQMMCLEGDAPSSARDLVTRPYVQSRKTIAISNGSVKLNVFQSCMDDGQWNTIAR